MTKQINTGKANLLFVKEAYAGELDHFSHGDEQHMTAKIYTVVGFSDELTEDQNINIVEHLWSTFGVKYFKDYTGKGWAFDSASESYDSLLIANEIYTVNPFEKPDDKPINELHNLRMGIDKHIAEWEEYRKAEANTGKWLVLKKID